MNQRNIEFIVHQNICTNYNLKGNGANNCTNCRLNEFSNVPKHQLSIYFKYTYPISMMNIVR